MKPQLVMLDPSGSHNRDLAKTRAALIKGGSWKKQRIVEILPAGLMLPAKAAHAQKHLIYPPNQLVLRILAQGMEVGEAYSNAIAEVLAHQELSKWEYILTLEHDNMPPADGLLKLIARMEAHREFACIGGLYFTKGEGGVAQIWGDVTDPMPNFRPQLPDPAGGLVECRGTGMGFNLWRISMFRDEMLRRPWFKTIAGTDGVGTQDLYFWGDARKYGYRCAVDCSVRVGHYDPETDQVY